jgi:hypothetical protein
MSNLEGKTSRDYLAGFNPYGTISKPVEFGRDFTERHDAANVRSAEKVVRRTEIRALPVLVHNANGGSKFSSEIKSIFAIAVDRVLEDLKSKGFKPVHSENKEG